MRVREEETDPGTNMDTEWGKELDTDEWDGDLESGACLGKDLGTGADLSRDLSSGADSGNGAVDGMDSAAGACGEVRNPFLCFFLQGRASTLSPATGDAAEDTAGPGWLQTDQGLRLCMAEEQLPYPSILKKSLETKSAKQCSLQIIKID